MVSNQESGPNYYVRIFTSDGEVNLDNVISITTNKDVNSDTGSFNILLDYNQNVLGDQNNTFNAVTFKQDSIFFKIKPMDYIEIYMARDLSTTGISAVVKGDQTSVDRTLNRIGKHHGFGVYDIDGSFVRNFDEKYENNKYRVLDKNETESLNIVERVLNPHLVFCGFVDGISNSFAINEESTANNVLIRGRCLGKFFTEHHLFFNFPYSDILFRIQEAAVALNGFTANEAIDYILTKFCWEIFSESPIEISKTDLDGGEKIKDYEKAYFSIKKTFYTDAKTNRQIEKVIHNDLPSFKYIYWGTSIKSAKEFINHSQLTAENGYFKWGRMYYGERVNTSNFNINASSPVLSILKQGAQLPFNEFFVDEIGNIVLRKTLDAWDYSKDIDDEGNFIEDSDSYIQSWVELNQEDIINWNFDISDDELKTVVLSIPSADLFGSQPVMTGQVGVAPLAKENIEVLIDKDKQRVKEEKSILREDSSSQELRETIDTINKQQSNHLDEYDLSTRDGILNFWHRFGIRPVQINDMYSDTTSKFYMSAWSLFQKYANYWWKGSIMVKGDSKYKVGQKLKIRKFALDENNILRDFNCYVQAVSQNFQWGQRWVTTLSFTRGEIEGTVSSQTVKSVDKKDIKNEDLIEEENVNKLNNTEYDQIIPRKYQYDSGFQIPDEQIVNPNITTQ